MIYRFIILSIVFFSILFPKNWIYENNNPWDINTDPRSSALGGIDLYNYLEFTHEQSHIDNINLFSSRMFNDIINYSNIYYLKNIDSLVILGNTFNKVKIGLLNRVIKNIENTTLVWSPSSSNEPILADLNYDLIQYYDHRDVGISFFIPFSNNLGDFGLDFRPAFSKINRHHSVSFNLDFLYFRKISNKFSIMTSVNNIFSYKKWSNQSIEWFCPEFEIIAHFQLKNTIFFIELYDIYLDTEFLNNYRIVENLKIGVEHSINEKFRLRLGKSSNYQTYGFGVEIDNFIFDYSYLKHEKLDYSSQFAITYKIKN